MTEYALYLESGPKRRTTMVHVLDLLGCVVRGPTTEAALAATPAAIRDFLTFLRRHGDGIDPNSAVATRVAEHVMDGPWLGYGNPAPGFGPDFAPLSTSEAETLLDRLAWLQGDFAGLTSRLTIDQMRAEPASGGRSIGRIVGHVAESHCAYVRSTVGPVEGLPGALRDVMAAPEAPRDALKELWRVSNERLRAMSEEERTRAVPHGQVTWTARRGLRRMLEHLWEHEQEVAARLA